MGIRKYSTNPRRVLFIESSMVDLKVYRDSETKVISKFSFFGIDISSLYGAGQIPQDAEIVLEIRNKNDHQRESLGSYSNPKTIRDKCITLENKASLTFYVFIKNGFEILASNEHVKPKDEDRDEDRQGILVVEPSDDLGQVAWRVSPVDGSSEPKLLINSDIELNIMLKLDKGEEIWRTLIFPNALEQILYLLVKYNENDGNNEESWVKKWENYFESENFEKIPSSSLEEADVVKDWVEEIVRAISDRSQFITKLKDKLKFND